MTSAVGGTRGNTLFPGWAIGGTQEAPGGWFALILRRMTNVSRPSRAKPNQEATQEAQGLVCAHLEAHGQCEKWLRI